MHTHACAYARVLALHLHCSPPPHLLTISARAVHDAITQYDDLEFVLQLVHREDELADLMQHVGFKPGHAARFKAELAKRAC